MKTCRICGLQFEDKEFYKIKHLYKYINFGKRIWCRHCQKLYVEMKKLEIQQKQMEEMKGTFEVSFI